MPTLSWKKGCWYVNYTQFLIKCIKKCHWFFRWFWKIMFQLLNYLENTNDSLLPYIESTFTFSFSHLWKWTVAQNNCELLSKEQHSKIYIYILKNYNLWEKYQFEIQFSFCFSWVYQEFKKILSVCVSS